MPIDVKKFVGFTEEFTNILKTDAQALIKKRPLGGVTEESAKGAVQKAVEDVKVLAEKIADDAAAKLADFKGKSADEMVKLTNEKDLVILSGKAKIKELKKGKRFERQLGNGNKPIGKTSPDGVVVTKEVTPEGKVVKLTGKDIINNTKRETVYNTKTGQRKYTTDNVNGEKTFKYKEDVSVQTKGVYKDKIVNNPNGTKQITREYADGSYDIITPPGPDGIYGKTASYTKDNKMYKTLEKEVDANGKIISTTETLYSAPNTWSSIKTINTGGNTYKQKYFKDSLGNGYKIIEEKTTLGHIKTIGPVKDEYGILTGNPGITVKYPKGSKIKKSVIEMDASRRDLPQKETVFFADGSKAELTNFTLENKWNYTDAKPGKVKFFGAGEKEGRDLAETQWNKLFLESGKANNYTWSVNNTGRLFRSAYYQV